MYTDFLKLFSSTQRILASFQARNTKQKPLKLKLKTLNVRRRYHQNDNRAFREILPKYEIFEIPGIQPKYDNIENLRVQPKYEKIQILKSFSTPKPHKNFNEIP